MSIRVQILDSGGFFGRRRALIRRTIDAALAHVHAICGLTDVDLVIHPNDHGPDQFCISAFTMGPHNIHIGIERSQLSSDELEADLYRTLVHELHHALRWRHVARKWSVGEVIVLEGLALLADERAAGPHDDIARPLSDPDAALSYLARFRDADVAAHRAWLYAPEPAQPGGAARVYTIGRMLMERAIDARGLGPWAAAAIPADDLLDDALALTGTVCPLPSRRKSA